MKTITVKFVDFWNGFELENYWLWKVINKRYDVVYSENPEYVISSAFGNEVCNYPDAIHILVSGEVYSPNWNVHDYALSFNKMSYEDRFFWMPPAFARIEEYKKIVGRKIDIDEVMKQKNLFCNFIYGNADGQKQREELFHEISKYKHVDSTGTWLNNQNPYFQTKRGEEKNKFQERCKFSIAVEEDSFNGYITEKIFEAISNYSVPIYYGDPLIEQIINPKAFINARNYSSYEELRKEIERIDCDDKLYVDMLTEPMLNDYSFFDNYLAEQREFVYHIFDQDISTAFRRPRKFSAKRNEDELNRIYKIDNSSSLKKKLLQLLKL